MGEKVRIAVVGLGKMGLSHFAMVNAHPDTETLACDATGFLVDMLGKYIPNKIYKKYDDLLEAEQLDAVIIATPSRFHGPMVRAALDKGINVFCEKPFCLDPDESEQLADLAAERGLINQVGYHYRYVGAFQQMKKIADSGALGNITHVLAEAYGPVILRAKRQSWRTQKSEGGGCLYDYAAHPLNMLNWVFGAPEQVSGSVLNSIYSKDIDDEVYSTLRFGGGVTAQLSVNWSDASHRKMTTKISMIGTNGRLHADRQEVQLYLREASAGLPGYDKGWNVKYTTELTEDPWFYLRGEEYSNQIDDFVSAVRDRTDGVDGTRENDFRSAAITDRSITMIQNDNAQAQSEPATTQGAGARKRSWFARS